MPKPLAHHVKQRKKSQSRWDLLYKDALARARASKDPRLRDLKHWSKDPETALRRLSILTRVDLDREFPSLPPASREDNA